MSQNLHIAVLIMAAGASKRMDGIKQLLPWKTSNFLLETIKTVKESNATSIHVVLGANADSIIDQCNLEEQNVELIINPDWSLGLGKSIALGVKKLTEKKHIPDGILICLADQPLLSTEYLNSVITSYTKQPSKIVASIYRNRAGVPALFPKFFYPNLVLLEGDQGAKNILEDINNEIIVLNAHGQLTDIDTKDDYDQLQTNFQNENK
ncbi:nucleotidyltransferase family protein [Maribacter sp. X9]|uniref:nucleotidyltransferase family protein n=1 Tax=Maribacter sp. X9 TaxID=3402159 RepID=UPI003AF3D55C